MSQIQRDLLKYQKLRNFQSHGVTRTSEKEINVMIPSNDDPDFGAVEMMISLSGAANSAEENKGKTDLELFAESNESIFAILGEPSTNWLEQNEAELDKFVSWVNGE